MSPDEALIICRKNAPENHGLVGDKTQKYLAPLEWGCNEYEWRIRLHPIWFLVLKLIEFSTMITHTNHIWMYFFLGLKPSHCYSIHRLNLRRQSEKHRISILQWNDTITPWYWESQIRNSRCIFGSMGFRFDVYVRVTLPQQTIANIDIHWPKFTHTKNFGRTCFSLQVLYYVAFTTGCARPNKILFRPTDIRFEPRWDESQLRFEDNKKLPRFFVRPWFADQVGFKADI